MRLKFSLLPCIIFFATTILIVGCGKDGDTGPAGPAGPAGAAGPAGPAGAAGAAGTANVIYSPWMDTLTFIPITDTVGTVIDTLGYFADISAPKLDLDMLNKGEIKVYINLNTAADPVVFPLPWTNGAVFIDPAFFLNTIEITSNADLGQFQIPFRYVLIPGGTAARPGPGGKTINWNNYKEVQKYLGLTD